MGWNPLDHPRDDRGRFRKKTKVSLRVGTRSATVTVGRTFPIIPGKVGLHLGVLARVENISQKQGYLSKLSDKVLNKLSRFIPEENRELVQGILKSRRARVGGIEIGQIGGSRRASSIRLTNSVKQSKSATSGTRAPRRKPRTRSAARAATQGKRVR